MLDDHGLAAALDWYGKQFARRVGITVSVQADDPEVRIAPQMGIALFRIAQEALNNVAKHSKAQHVVITLWRDGSELAMSISDDGVGLTPAHERGFGMVTMRERAEALDGRFSAEALTGRGTRVSVRRTCATRVRGFSASAFASRTAFIAAPVWPMALTRTSCTTQRFLTKNSAFASQVRRRASLVLLSRSWR